MIEATIVADSLNAATGHRLTSFVLTYPRFIHSEIMTHRVYARNSASSRAIPSWKVLRNVIRDPVIPVRFGRAQRGMQDAGALSAGKARCARWVWLGARYPAVAATWCLDRVGVHKQISNRIVEPWVWMTTLVTGTDWENFYRLRRSPHAQPEFDELARRMLEEHAKSEPARLEPGQWHVPFGDGLAGDCRLKIATARCARISYGDFYGRNDPVGDVQLHDRLLRDKHMSPFEHPAQASAEGKRYGCYRGFVPHRKTIPGETHDDDREPTVDFKALAGELSR